MRTSTTTKKNQTPETVTEVVPRFVSLNVAGDRVGLCARTIRRAIGRGELTGYKLGSALRVDLDELDAWVRSQALPTARAGAR